MDDGILRSNRVAGSCDQYTKASEIKELAKFLGALKKHQDENTKLDESSLDIKGGAAMNKIESLSNKIETMPPGFAESLVLERIKNQEAEKLEGTNSVKLSETSEKLIGSVSEPNSLPDTIISGEGNNPKVTLGNGSERVEGVQKKVKLPGNSEKLNSSGHKKVSLPAGSEKVEGTTTRKVKLSALKERVQGKKSRISKLDQHQETLQGKTLGVVLSDKKESLTVKEKVSGLSKGLEKIEIPEEKINLETGREKLETSEKVTELSAGREKLLGNIPPSISLPDQSEKLEGQVESVNLDTTGTESILGKPVEAKLVVQEARKMGDGHKEVGPLPAGKNKILGDIIDPELGRTKEHRLPGDQPEKLELHEGTEKIGGKLSEPDLTTRRERIGGGKVEITKLGGDQKKVHEGIKEIELGEGKEKLFGNEPQLSLDDLLLEVLGDGLDENLSLVETKEARLGEDVEVALGSESEKILGPLNNDTELETVREDLSVNLDAALSDYQEKLDTTDIGELSSERVDFSPTNVDSLSTARENISVDSTIQLSDTKIGGPHELEIALGTGRSGIDSDRNKDEALGKTQLNSEKESVGLGEYGVTVEERFPGSQEKRTSDHPDESQGRKEFGPDGELYTDVLARDSDKPSPDHKELDLTGVSDITDVNGQIIKETDLDKEVLDKHTSDTFHNSESKGRSKNQHQENEINVLKLVEQYKTTGDTDGYYKFLLRFADGKSGLGWGEKKIASLVSSYLGGGELTPDRVKQFEEALYRTAQLYYSQIEKLDIPELTDLDNTKVGPSKKPENKVKELSKHLTRRGSMKLPELTLDTSISSFYRFSAEKSVGILNSHGKLRERLLDETLAVLISLRDEHEKRTHSSPSQLPGKSGGLANSLLNRGVNGLIQDTKKELRSSVTSTFFSKPDTSVPANFPKKETIGWTKLNNIDYGHVVNASELASVPTGKLGFWEKVKKVLSDVARASLPGERGQAGKDYIFKETYIDRQFGMQITLDDLAESKRPASVEGLMDALSESGNITTASKLTSTKRGTNVLTLDSNAYWEVVLTPYVGALNGGISFLPPIQEINVWNRKNHGYNTNYNTFIPITGFELQKAKLSNRSTALFDGEISYPVSMEFTNELRITIADDQYKSWRNYFERCAEVAIYSSVPHKKEDYSPKYWGLTVVDKNFQVVSPYKNISFLCTVYCMTPQYGTINKYELLLVMKDYTEERAGESDAGGGDVSVMFSIVGENPYELDAISKINRTVKGMSGGKMSRELNSVFNKKSTNPDVIKIL